MFDRVWVRVFGRVRILGGLGLREGLGLMYKLFGK